MPAATKDRTLRKASELVSEIADSPLQSSLLLTFLAATALTSPAMAVVSAVAGAAFLMRKRRPPLGLLGGEPLPGCRPTSYEIWQTYLLGTHAETGEPIRMTSDSVRQHFLVVGAPGGARSEALTGMAESFVALGSGAIHVDGRGDPRAARRLRGLAAKHAREDDYLFLDLRPRDKAGPTLALSVFSTVSSDLLTQMLVGLMPRSGADDAMWAGRATGWFVALLGCLCWQRGEGVPLDAARIVANLDMDALHRMAAGEGEWEGLPEGRRETVRSYLRSIYGYQEDRGARQSQAVREQHGHLEMLFGELLRPLAEDYAHVLPGTGGAIDVSDVVLRRRILSVTLPAPGEGSPIGGRFIMACIKSMMLALLTGSEGIGTPHLSVMNISTRYPHPILCVLDDVGDYMVEGLALMAAQARSLGFSMAYGADDLASLAASNEREAASIRANTNTQILLSPGHSETNPEPGVGHPGTMFHKAETIPFRSHVVEDLLHWRDETVFHGFVPFDAGR